MKYYIVTAKCGHVGKGKYVEMEIPVYSESAHEASQYVLTKPKVKKQLKNAISYITEVSFDEYKTACCNYHINPYVRAHTKKEIVDYIYMAEELDKRYKLYKSSFETRQNRIHYLKRKYKIMEELSLC